MAIKIHHGPNGSYKTSGAVWDDAVPAAKEGRLIITNVRGMSRDRFEALFDDLPDTFDVLFISHESTEGMERIRTWFQWAPRNAFLIFDEAQVIFPSKWTSKEVERFNYPGGPDKAKLDDKPTDWLSAWTMHRHFNWDVILTMPNIKYLHTDIRNTSEAAYQHSNLMLLGKWTKKLVQKDYKEAMHSAQENKAPTDGSNIVQLRKIDVRVFSLYDSTATGLHRDTMAGKNALASPRVLVLGGVAALVIGGVFYVNDGNPFHNPLGTVAAKTGVQPPQNVPVKSPQQAINLDPVHVSAEQNLPPVPLSSDPFSGFDIVIKGSVTNVARGTVTLFQLSQNDRSFMQTSDDLQQTGYGVIQRGPCVADLTFPGGHRTVICSGAASGGGERLGSERAAATGGGPFASSGVQAPGFGNGANSRGANYTVVPDNSRTPRTLLSGGPQ
ncbi:zonular occludens toxin domain-containing protein [Pseudomonas huanghezhanensis]|uniref:zonular occludens toxin domain-containing protein n=1 Tax=Pseudomonas huanghezhanensis TaxID=3002903 RepID=UPI00228673BA|nr:zonular occludens toxin domain-containing protein [Pseudomonas sp. BSw22131]